MNPFEMVLGIIIVVTIGKVLQSHFRYRARADRTASTETAESRQLKGEVQL